MKNMVGSILGICIGVVLLLIVNVTFRHYESTVNVETATLITADVNELKIEYIKCLKKRATTDVSSHNIIRYDTRTRIHTLTCTLKEEGTNEQ